MGIIITIAEPDLQVLANQVASIPNDVLIYTIAAGVGIFLLMAFLRIYFKIRLTVILTILYAAVFALSFFAPRDFIPVAFDSGGVTIMKGMREESNAVATQFSIPLKDEQDFVMILVLKEKKHEIMSAIREKCGINTEAHGIVFSIPIDSVFGIG